MKDKENRKSQFIAEVELSGHNKYSQAERLLSYARKIKGNVQTEK